MAAPSGQGHKWEKRKDYTPTDMANMSVGFAPHDYFYDPGPRPGPVTIRHYPFGTYRTDDGGTVELRNGKDIETYLKENPGFSAKLKATT